MKKVGKCSKFVGIFSFRDLNRQRKIYFLVMLISGLVVSPCFNGRLDDWGLFLLTSKGYAHEWFLTSSNC